MVSARPTSTALYSIDGPTDRDRPPWLLMCLCLAILLVPPYVAPLGKRILWLPLIVAGGLLVLTTVQFAVRRRTTSRITIKPGIVILLVYVLLRLVSFTQGAAPAQGGLLDPDWRLPLMFMVATVGIAVYAMMRIRTPNDSAAVFGALAVGLTYLCGVGILQNYAHIDLRLFFQLPGMREGQQMSLYAVNTGTAPRYDAERSYGTADHASDFAILAAVTVPLMLHLARFAPSGLGRAAATLGTGIAFIAILAGNSRSGVVALAGAFLVYIWALKMRRLAAMVGSGFAVILVLAAVVGTSKVTRSFDALERSVTEGASLTDPSVVARIERYAAISQSFSEHPFIGLGVGRFPPNIFVLDNQWLKGIVEGGLTGLMALLVFAVGGIVGISASLRRATNDRQRDEAFVAGAMFTGILASSFGIDLLLFAQVSLIFFLSFGLLWAPFSAPIYATK